MIGIERDRNQCPDGTRRIVEPLVMTIISGRKVKVRHELGPTCVAQNGKVREKRTAEQFFTFFRSDIDGVFPRGSIFVSNA